MNFFKSLLILPIFALTLFWSGCQKEEIVIEYGTDLLQAITINGTSCTDLIAGQNTNVGDVCATTDGSNICITYTTTGSWEIDETHVWIGKNLGDMPQTNKGNAIPGQFPYHSGDLSGTGTQTWQVCVTAAELGINTTDCDEQIYIASHAAVADSGAGGTGQTETAWGDGDRFVSRGPWGMSWNINITCDGSSSNGDCETAFALLNGSETCFLDLDLDNDPTTDDFNRWGWTNYVTNSGTGTAVLWAGAGSGQGNTSASCVTANGTDVGDVQIAWDGDGTAVVVTYSLDPGYNLDEVHTYVGSDEVATNSGNGSFTVAPGQYTVISEELGDGIVQEVHTISNVTGPFYVIAHAVVCGF